MVVAQSQGSIACPRCRQATILNEQKEADETLAADEGQTQVVLPLPMGDLPITPHTSTVCTIEVTDVTVLHRNFLARH